MTTEELKRLSTLMQQYNDLMEPMSGGRCGITFNSPAFSWGTINFATSWKGFIGQIEFSSLADAVRTLEKLVEDVRGGKFDRY